MNRAGLSGTALAAQLGEPQLRIGVPGTMLSIWLVSFPALWPPIQSALVNPVPWLQPHFLREFLSPLHP